MRKTLLAAFLASSACLAVPAEAHALGPVDLEIAAKGGYAGNPGSGDPNPLGVGIGGRAGVSFLGGIYGGINLLYYFGGSSTPLPGTSASVHSLLYGIEAGYGLTLVDILTLRAQLGVGNITVSNSLSGPPLPGNVTVAGSGSVNNLYLEPGITAMLGFGLYFIGADANLLVLPGIEKNSDGSSSTETAFTLHGQVGVKF